LLKISTKIYKIYSQLMCTIKFTNCGL